MNKIHILLLTIIAFAGCHKKDDPIVETVPQLKFNFKNVVNGRSLELKTGVYTNDHGDTFSVKTYNYYISNISLTTDDGKVFTEPESYHLVCENIADSKTFTIENLPVGNYNKIRFMIGVDSLRNVSGAQTGALDVTNGMFWDWNQGYIMAKLEGTSPQSGIKDFLEFHIGGYKGGYNSLRWATLSFPQNALVNTNKQPTITIASDVAEWFKTPKTIDFHKSFMVAVSDVESVDIANNYADMFRVSSVQN